MFYSEKLGRVCTYGFLGDSMLHRFMSVGVYIDSLNKVVGESVGNQADNVDVSLYV